MSISPLNQSIINARVNQTPVNNPKNPQIIPTAQAPSVPSNQPDNQVQSDTFISKIKNNKTLKAAGVLMASVLALVYLYKRGSLVQITQKAEAIQEEAVRVKVKAYTQEYEGAKKVIQDVKNLIDEITSKAVDSFEKDGVTVTVTHDGDRTRLQELILFDDELKLLRETKYYPLTGDIENITYKNNVNDVKYNKINKPKAGEFTLQKNKYKTDDDVVHIEEQYVFRKDTLDYAKNRTISETNHKFTKEKVETSDERYHFAPAEYKYFKGEENIRFESESTPPEFMSFCKEAVFFDEDGKLSEYSFGFSKNGDKIECKTTYQTDENGKLRLIKEDKK